MAAPAAAATRLICSKLQPPRSTKANWPATAGSQSAPWQPSPRAGSTSRPLMPSVGVPGEKDNGTWLMTRPWASASLESPGCGRWMVEGLALHLVEAGGQQLLFDVRGGRSVPPAAGCPGAVGSHGDLLELAQLRNQGFAGHRVRQCRTGAGGRVEVAVAMLAGESGALLRPAAPGSKTPHATRAARRRLCQLRGLVCASCSSGLPGSIVRRPQ